MTGYGYQAHLLLAVASAIARRHHEAEPPWDGVSLAQALEQPASAVQAALDQLVAGGFLYPLGGAPRRYLPARAAEIIPVQALLDLVWDGGQTGPDALLAEDPIGALMARLQAAQSQALAGVSLKDLLAGEARP